MVKALRILIADDQKHARRSLRALLATKFQPVETFEAVNGIEALACMEEFNPDLVLIDAWMPEMDGIEATRNIKARWQLPVIILSLYPDYEEAAISAGADAFIRKGEPADQLLAAIAQMVSTTCAKNGGACRSS